MWDYFVYDLPNWDAEATRTVLQALGEQGWELVSVVGIVATEIISEVKTDFAAVGQTETTGYRLFLKRLVK